MVNFSHSWRLSKPNIWFAIFYIFWILQYSQWLLLLSLGGLNTVDGLVGSISGGAENYVFGEYSSISGGYNNETIGNYSSLLGGSAVHLRTL